MTRGVWLLLVVLATGCGGVARKVSLDVGTGHVITFTPTPGVEPVALDGDDFKEAVTAAARDLSISVHSRPAALRLLDRTGSPGSAPRYRTRLGLVREPGPKQPEALDASAVALTGAYGRWCARKGGPVDCLHLMDDGPALDVEDRRALAFRLALDSVFGETAEAVGELVDRDAMVSMLVATGVLYFSLWLLPEPVSKGVAAVLTVGLIAYLGWDTVWSLIQGWRVLAHESEDARTFDEVRDAGEKYGQVMGRNAARVFIMLATAALSGSAQVMAERLPLLPGSGQASVLAAAQGGFRFPAAAQVEAVAVSASGALTISLAPGAVAMTAQAGGAVEVDGPEHHIASDKFSTSTRNGGPWTPRYQRIFDRAGMSLDDPANKVRVPGHKGPHPEEYHEEVFDRLTRSTGTCRTVEQCRVALTEELQQLAKEICTPDTLLNRLVTRTP
ncbi:hypothetical protein D7V97_18015 [Corallococcus sp. CA053C]|uniref:AHH domain-containing protein n=1 Tax=Corallococcus sp. CA053C TaxID=2316732 RepID=UPI000EA14E9C|nr:AHH domain-containing protein [Corallococcus sp. CA053C]RKH08953.1 hypothetical protein D7V97_18015 [Corallococcus sp. CA053C]